MKHRAPRRQQQVGTPLLCRGLRPGTGRLQEILLRQEHHSDLLHTPLASKAMGVSNLDHKQSKVDSSLGFPLQAAVANNQDRAEAARNRRWTLEALNSSWSVLVIKAEAAAEATELTRMTEAHCSWPKRAE